MSAAADRPREAGPRRHDPAYVISVAAEMAGMHPQTLRQYDRLGIVVPQRQGGRHRRYSPADVEHLRAVQSLSREGVSLEGIRRILALQRDVERLQDTVAELASQVDRLHSASALARVFSVGAAGDVSARYAAPVAPAAGSAARQGAGRPVSHGTVRALTSARSRRVLTWRPSED